MATMTDKIQLANIDEELQKLWKSEHQQKKIRASLFNLILYVQKSDRADFYKNLIKSVVSKFPCRVILIINEDKPDAEYLRTSVSSETLGEGDLRIFCEIIKIEVAGKLSERVPFIILPHLLPDLPVYLLWTQDPTTENAILPHLEPFADRIIFDSESTSNLQRYCRAVLTLMLRFHSDIGDLNWSALSGWRNTFAQVFNTQETLLSLIQSKMIRIYYNKNPNQFLKHTEIQAAYFQAWLASRLNWKFQAIEQDEGNIRLIYRRPLHEIIILLIPQENDSHSPGSVLAVEIESSKDKGFYSFKRHPQTKQVFIQYSEKDLCHLPYCTYLGGASAGQEIVEEIFNPSGGKHYRDMLDVLATAPWKI